MSDRQAGIAVIVVNYRTPDLVIDCLSSLAEERASGVQLRTIVVENASGDDSSSRIRDAVASRGFSAWCQLVEASQNGGFAAGNVFGLEALRRDGPLPEFVLLLNPDTVVRPGAIDACIDFAAKHPRAGILGCRLEDPDGSIQTAAFRFPGVLTELLSGCSLGILDRVFAQRLVRMLQPEEPFKADWVSGAFMLLRRELIDEVGLLDPAFFLYFEEVDLCWRSQGAGWECWQVPQARTVHLVGASTGFSDSRRAQPRRPAYWFASRRLFFTRHLGRGGYLAADLAFTFGALSRKVRKILTGRRDGLPPRFLRDLWSHQVGRPAG